MPIVQETSSATFISAWREQILGNQNVEAIFGKTQAEKDRFMKWFESLELYRQEQFINSSLAITEKEPIRLPYDREVEYLKKFLFRYKLRPLSDEIYSNIQQGDLIEVYDDKGIQIYRSWNLFEFCRYTIDQLLSRTWDDLYERPEFVEKKLFSLLPVIFGNPEPLMEYHIAEYLLSERYVKPKAYYSFKMKYLAPLEGVSDSAIQGFFQLGLFVKWMHHLIKYYLFSSSLSSLPTLKKGNFFSGTLITSPVRGLRPW